MTKERITRAKKKKHKNRRLEKIECRERKIHRSFIPQEYPKGGYGLVEYLFLQFMGEQDKKNKVEREKEDRSYSKLGS